MDNLEEQLGSVLGNPEMMQKIMLSHCECIDLALFFAILIVESIGKWHKWQVRSK